MTEESIFTAALEKSDPAEREAYLDWACEGNPALRARVEALLGSHEGAGSFLDRPDLAEALTGPVDPNAGTPTLPPRSAEEPGTRIGPYKLLQKIGEGGMGTVWMAEQLEPVRRTVALKVVKAGLDSTQVIARFEAERQALALMDHPNIAKVLDAGTIGGRDEGGGMRDEKEKDRSSSSLIPHPSSLSSGRPYFVMELVKGTPITKYCDAQRLSLRQRLELFIPVCQALQHAHQKGIIHRDIKPSNVLIAPYDGKPVVKVIDFGVAKATGMRLTEKTMFTEFGAVIGTLEYMSPEQAELNNQDIDTRSDIYSLGVLLYELLTSTTPLDMQRLRGVAMAAILMQIQEQEPPRPSTRISQSGQALGAISAQRQTQPARLAGLVRGELDWIVMRALEKERGRRYETSSAFAADVERFLRNEPVLAGPPSALYKLRKFVRRNRGPVTAACVVLLAVVLGALGTTWEWIHAVQAGSNETRARLATADALEKEADARKATDKALVEAKALAKANNELAEKETASRKRAQQALFRSEALLYNSSFREAFRHVERNDFVAARLSLDDCRWDLRGGEYGYLARKCSQVRLLYSHMGPVASLVVSADGKRLYSGSGDGNTTDNTIKVWDLEAGRQILTLRGHQRGVGSLALSADGKRLCSGEEHEIKVWDLEEGKETFTLHGGGHCLALSADGKRLYSGGSDSSITVWDLDAGKETLSLHGHTKPVTSLVLSADGKRLFSGSLDKTIKVWDLETGKETVSLRGHNREVTSLAVSADSKRLYSGGGCEDKTIKVWDLEANKEILSLRGHTFQVTSLALSADGKKLYSASADVSADGSWLYSVSHDQTIKVWDLESGKQTLSLRGHTGGVSSLALSADGRRLYSASSDTTIKVWDLEADKESLTLRGHTGAGGVRSLALSADGKRLYSGGGFLDDTIKVWDLTAGKESRTLWGHTDSVNGLALSPDGKRLYSASDDQTIKVWDVDAGKETCTLRGHTGVVNCLALSADGKRLFSGGSDSTIKVWDVEAADPEKSVLTLRGRAAGVSSLALSADGKRLYAGSYGTIKVWDLDARKENVTLRGHTNAVTSLALSADGKRLFSGGSDSTIRVWDLDAGKEVLMLRGDTDGATFTSLALSADGKRLYSGLDRRSHDTIKVWDLDAGKEILAMRGHTDRVTSLALSANGKQLYSASQDKTIKVWELEAGEEILTVRGHADRVTSLTLSADGKRLYSGSWDSTIKVWDLEAGKETLSLRGHAGGVTGLALSADGKRLYSASSDNSIKVWDLEAGKETLSLRGHTDGVTSLALSADGKRLYSASHDKTIKVWDLEAGKDILTLRGHAGEVSSLALSADGKLLYSGGGYQDGTIKAWDLNAGKETITLRGNTDAGALREAGDYAEGVSSLALSADGKHLYSGNYDNSIKVWDLDTGKETLTLPGVMDSSDWVNGLVHGERSVPVLSDGKRLYSGSWDRTIKAWDLDTGKETRTLRGHLGPVTSLVLSSDGKRLFSASYDGTIKMWNLEPEK